MTGSTEPNGLPRHAAPDVHTQAAHDLAGVPAHVPHYLVNTDWLAVNLDRPDLRVFDCSATMLPDPDIQQRVHPEWEAFEAGHVPGAQFIDIDAMLSDRDHPVHLMLPPAAAFAAAMASLGVSNDSFVVIYSTANVWWATRVWWMLRVYGFDNAHVLDGGFAKWQAEQRPIATGRATPPMPGNFVAAPPRPLVADRARVREAIRESPAPEASPAAPRTRIVNALRPAQYSGAELPRKGRPGHIPTSVNIPAASLLDPRSGCLLDDASLHAAFKRAGVSDAQPVIAYCGGGVSASLVTFALHKLGHPDVRLYDASLGEWGSDPSLPMQIEQH